MATTIIMGPPVTHFFAAKERKRREQLRSNLDDRTGEYSSPELAFNSMTGLYEVNLGAPVALGANCRNCGAPREPGMCSYCGTRHG